MKHFAPGMLPKTNTISYSMCIQSAFRFGEYHGHMGLFSVNSSMVGISDKVSTSSSYSQFSDWLFDGHFPRASSNKGYQRRLGRAHITIPDNWFGKVSSARQLLTRTQGLLRGPHGS